MTDLFVELALPRTDAGAFAQAAAAVPVFGVALWRVRTNREIRTFVAGLTVITFAWFALRTIH